MSSSDENRRVLDILDNIDAALGYMGTRDLEAFAHDSLVIDASERCLQRITEAAVKLGEEPFAQIAPNVRFASVKGMGNMLRHEYDLINPRIIYETVRFDLPVLGEDCRRFLAARGYAK